MIFNTKQPITKGKPKPMLTPTVQHVTHSPNSHVLDVC